jgi:hypothetical protein
MKTAVEFLIKELQLDVFANDEEMATIIKAKEMEEEQRKKDFRAGWHGNKHKDWNCEFYLQRHLTNQFQKQENERNQH